jgi:hypothetical protein
MTEEQKKLVIDTVTALKLPFVGIFQIKLSSQLISVTSRMCQPSVSKLKCVMPYKNQLKKHNPFSARAKLKTNKKNWLLINVKRQPEERSYSKVGNC